MNRVLIVQRHLAFMNILALQGKIASILIGTCLLCKSASPGFQNFETTCIKRKSKVNEKVHIGILSAGHS